MTIGDKVERLQRLGEKIAADSGSNLFYISSFISSIYKKIAAVSDWISFCNTLEVA